MSPRLITETVRCPDCWMEADPAVGGNHGGDCVRPELALPVEVEVEDEDGDDD